MINKIMHKWIAKCKKPNQSMKHYHGRTILNREQVQHPNNFKAGIVYDILRIFQESLSKLLNWHAKTPT